MRMQLCATIAIGLMCSLFSAGANAQDVATEDGNTGAGSPLRNGPYALVMPTYFLSQDDSILDDAFGGVAGVGFRRDWYAFELSAHTVDRGTPKELGGAVNALVFPFSGLPSLYATAGVGAMRLSNLPTGEVQDRARPGTLSGGLGYLFPLQFGNYEFAIRAEAKYRYGHREERRNPVQTDINVDRNFEDVLIGLGLHLPLGFIPPPPPPPPPVNVVPPVSICSDGQDNDGDGLIDFPGDPGCSAVDDNDETDPPQCSDGKDNDGDGLIDFPADKGCTGADDNDEVDPCKTPAAGERISLKGCGLGDIIVLRGVNFEFDKARLTTNAKTILDNVGEELTAYPDIEVELSGHTDSKGSDEYNQTLSEKRAASVKAYLVKKDIAEARMTTAGLGESQSVADNETDEGRELNRRVELKVTKGVAAGGPTLVTKTAGEAAIVADPSETATGDTAAELVPPAAEAAAPAEAAPSDPFANATP